MRAELLEPGMMIDLEPVITWLIDQGICDDEEEESSLMYAQCIYSEVESIDLEANNVVCIYSEGGNYAIDRDFDVPVVGRDGIHQGYVS